MGSKQVLSVDLGVMVMKEYSILFKSSAYCHTQNTFLVGYYDLQGMRSGIGEVYKCLYAWIFVISRIKRIAK